MTNALSYNLPLKIRIAWTRHEDQSIYNYYVFEKEVMNQRFHEIHHQVFTTAFNKQRGSQSR